MILIQAKAGASREAGSMSGRAAQVSEMGRVDRREAMVADALASERNAKAADVDHQAGNDPTKQTAPSPDGCGASAIRTALVGAPAGDLSQLN